MTAEKDVDYKTTVNNADLRGLYINLQKIAHVFRRKYSKNEATTRNFINPVMVEAVALTSKSYPSMELAVEETFDGTRGFGNLDYVVYCENLAVLVTEAKATDLDKGIAQNLVQLHTASEVIKSHFFFFFFI